MIQVKVFDFEHEKDLEKEVNSFLTDFPSRDIVDIKFNVAVSTEAGEQFYCFSAMVIYRD
ncbi:sporulation protein Cse60 [Bacillus sp. 2205SS5-2]|uniref:sporulation protein Cse60 n=1 Tax=Bacillus sp. 2205SS5-2 TaxID=3109031 RepID=UPI003004576B